MPRFFWVAVLTGRTRGSMREYRAERMLRAVARSLLLLAFLAPLPVEAIEYRLRVANVVESGYFQYAEVDGQQPDSPFALDRLRTALDRGEVPSGVLVSRQVLPANAARARSFEAVAVSPAGEVKEEGQWQEIRWEGKPGEKVVWVVQGQGTHLQEVTGVGLVAGASGRFRHYVPYGASLSPSPLRVIRFPLPLIEFWEGKSGLWQRWLARSVDLGGGIAAIVGENGNLVYADSVFLVIQQGSAAATYTVAVAWRDRKRTRTNQWEGAGGGADPTAR